MAQSRLDAFTVSRTAALTERAQRLKRLHELVAQRRRIAEAFGVLPKKRRVSLASFAWLAREPCKVSTEKSSRICWATMACG